PEAKQSDAQPSGRTFGKLFGLRRAQHIPADLSCPVGFSRPIQQSSPTAIIGTITMSPDRRSGTAMGTLTKMVSANGAIKSLNSARSELDDASKTIAAEVAFPPADIRPSPGGAHTVFLRVTNPVNLAEAAQQSATTSQGDTFAVIHVPAAGDFAAVVVFNPSTQVESGQNFASIADEGGWPV